MLQAEQGSREASRGAADWLADDKKLLEDGFPLKFWLGWKRSWLLRQAEEAVFLLKARWGGCLPSEGGMKRLSSLWRLAGRGPGWGGSNTHRQWLVLVAGRGLRRLQVAGLTSDSWAWSASVGWRLLTYCVPDPGPGPQFLLGERQGAVVSPSPGWRLTNTAPGTPL